MARNKYTQTDNTTEDGQAIYHRQTGTRGRPVQFVKRGGKYKRLHTPKLEN